ncbi:MAG: C25 family cysteine peptidase [Candidatus Zixiibacteriota bacterium]
MREIGLTILLLLIAVQEVPATTAYAIELEPSAVSVSRSRREVSYPDFEPAAVGGNLLLCSKTFYIELRDAEQAGQFTYDVLDRQPIDLDVPANFLSDITTSADGTYDGFAESAALLDSVGFQPVHVIRQVTVDGSRFLEVAVFPVTVEIAGQAYLNTTIELRVGQREVSEDDLLVRQQIDPVTNTGKYSRPILSQSDGNPDYVIITSSSLVSFCQTLADYKNATGIRTGIRTIEEITSSYPGRDDAERLREYLKEFHAEGGVYVLLVGDETVLPVRYAYYRNADTLPTPDRLIPCDLYFADLTGSWNSDNDDCWGEPDHDSADLTPELLVGRLPFNSGAQISNYVDKLIAYETIPGGGDRGYLTRAFFYSSDQMRDYGGDGQHARIAAVYPGSFTVDTAVGLELASGNDPTPYNSTAFETAATLSEGRGIVNIIAHGCYDCFAVRTSGYNNWPKSVFYSQAAGSDNAGWNNLPANGKVSFYYSLACDNGAYEKDQPPFNASGDNLVAASLAAPDAGAVGFIAYSRWGWVTTSYLLQTAFFDSLFANPERPAAAAMYASHQPYHIYLDLIYGQIFFGDPTLRVYSDVPDQLSVRVRHSSGVLTVEVTADDVLVDNCIVVLSRHGELIDKLVTDSDGSASFNYSFTPDSAYTVAAVKTGYTVLREEMVPIVTSDVDDDGCEAPHSFALSQNYPNPFNPTTTVSFDLAGQTYVLLEIFNVLGQRVRTLVSERLPAGRHTIEWDGRARNGQAVAGGVYFYRFEAGGFTSVKKMTLLK